MKMGMIWRLQVVLAPVLLVSFSGCADFEQEGVAFCQRNPVRCGQDTGDAEPAPQPTPNAGTPDAGGTSTSPDGGTADMTAPPAVIAGENCSMALRSDGTVWFWGDNGKGQLGDGTTTARATPV
jgi:hypothetical protein